MKRLLALLLVLCIPLLSQVNPGVGNPAAVSATYKPTGATTAVRYDAALADLGVKPESYGARGNTTTDDYAALGRAIAGATDRPITLTRPYRVASNLTFPATCSVTFARGGSLVIDSGVTVTFNGNVNAGLHRIFNGSGTVAFGPSSVAEVYPQWWGALADTSAANSYHGTDCTAAIQSALDTLKPVRFTDGGYYVSASLKLPDQTSHPYKSSALIGVNSNKNGMSERGNCFIEAATDPLFEPKTTFVTTCPTTRVHIRNLCFQSHNLGTTMFKNIAYSGGIFEDNLVVGFGQVFSTTSAVAVIRNNKFIGQRDSVLKPQSNNYSADTWWVNNYFNGDPAQASVVLVNLLGSASCHFIGNYWDYAATGIWVNQCYGTAGKNEISGNTFDILGEAIKLSNVSELNISSNTFRRSQYSGKATYLPNCSIATPWSAIKFTDNVHTTTIVGNTYSDCDKFMYFASGGSGYYNLFEDGNSGLGCVAVDSTYLNPGLSSYPLGGTSIRLGSRDAWVFPSAGAIRDIQTDFLGGAVSDLPWQTTLVSSGTVSNGTSVAGHEGIARITSAASGSSGAAYLTAATQVVSGGESSGIVFQAVSTTNLLMRFGWANALSGTITDGIYAEISGTTLSGKSATTSVAGATGSTYTLAAGTWYHLVVRKNTSTAYGQYALYDMAGNLLWTDLISGTTIISTVPMQHGVYAANTSPSAATAMVDVDWMGLSLNHTPARGR